MMHNVATIVRHISCYVLPMHVYTCGLCMLHSFVSEFCCGVTCDTEDPMSDSNCEAIATIAEVSGRALYRNIGVRTWHLLSVVLLLCIFP